MRAIDREDIIMNSLLILSLGALSLMVGGHATGVAPLHDFVLSCGALGGFIVTVACVSYRTGVRVGQDNPVTSDTQ